MPLQPSAQPENNGRAWRSTQPLDITVRTATLPAQLVHVCELVRLDGEAAWVPSQSSSEGVKTLPAEPHRARADTP